MAAPPPDAASSDVPFEQTEDQLRDLWTACGLSAAAWPAALAGYERYWQLIGLHNAAAGLMGNVTRAGFFLKHVADSLAALRAYPDLFGRTARLADVGAGAGLPGIVLAVALPQMHLTAAESNHKKADFIALAAGELGLSGRVQVLARRSRELGRDPQYRRRFELVTARAVAPAEKLIRDIRGLIAPGGSAILYKTPQAVAAELPLARREAAKHGLALETSEVFSLPADAGKRQFIRILARPGA